MLHERCVAVCEGDGNPEVPSEIMGPSLEVVEGVEGVSRMMIELNLIRLRSCTKGGRKVVPQRVLGLPYSLTR